MPIAFPASALVLIAFASMAKGAEAAGDADKGRHLADRFCKGCHVIGAENRHGGIDSTPSFFPHERQARTTTASGSSP